MINFVRYNKREQGYRVVYEHCSYIRLPEEQIIFDMQIVLRKIKLVFVLFQKRTENAL
jgi:hypothetical protein